jgi:hypothetical protein
MTYGLVIFAQHIRYRIDEAVSHSAEPVRGDSAANSRRFAFGGRCN